jgi:hypothetical protein
MSWVFFSWEDHYIIADHTSSTITKPNINKSTCVSTYRKVNKFRTCWWGIMKNLFGRNVKLVLRKNFILLLFLLNLPVLCYVYYKLNLLNYAWYNRSHRSVLHCHTAPQDMKALINLSKDLHNTLTDLNVTHWLAYGRYGTVNNCYTQI